MKDARKLGKVWKSTRVCWNCNYVCLAFWLFIFSTIWVDKTFPTALNGISNEGVNSIFESITENTTLATLNLCSINSHFSYWKKTKFCKTKQTAENHVDHTKLHEISKSSLSELRMNSMLNLPLCNPRVNYLSKVLGNGANTTLKILDLSSSFLCACSFFLSKNYSEIWIFVTGWSYLQSEGIKQLCDFLEFDECLEELDISSNKFGDAGMTHLSRLFKKNSNIQLKTLKLGKSLFFVVGVKFKFFFTFPIQDGNLIKNEGCRQLFEALKTNSTLDTLSLGLPCKLVCNSSFYVHKRFFHAGSNILGVKACVHIAEYLKTNNSLKTLKMPSNQVNEVGFFIILSAICQRGPNCNLTELFMGFFFQKTKIESFEFSHFFQKRLERHPE